MKKLKYSLFSFGMAIALLVFFMNSVGWGELLRVYRNTNPHILSFALLLSCSGFFLNTHVWKNILEFLKVHMPFRTLLRLFYMSLFANYVTPFGQAGGEPFMAYILSKKSKIPYGQGLATIMSADIIGAIAPIFFSAIGLVYYILTQNVTTVMFEVILALICLGILIIFGIIILQTKRKFIEKIIIAVSRWIRRVLRAIKWDKKRIDRYFGYKPTVERINIFYKTFTAVIAEKRWSIVSFTLLSTLAQVLALYYCVLALGYTPKLLVFLAVLPLASLSSYLPLPGGLGGMEISIAYLLVLLCNLPIGIATGSALLFRVITYWIPLGVGGTLMAYTLRRPIIEI